jgi:hypothetical protein
VLDEVQGCLERGESIVLVVGLGRDQLLFSHWLQTVIARRISGCSFSRSEGPPAHDGRPRSVAIALTPSGTSPGDDARILEVPTPGFQDLLLVLYSRGREQVLHHGLLIPRSTQRAALESCAQRHQDNILSRACDLIDESALAFQQSLLALARSTDEARRLESSMGALARAIRAAADPASRSGTCWRQTLGTIRAFERDVLSLGGPPHAASLPPDVLHQ